MQFRNRGRLSLAFTLALSLVAVTAYAQQTESRIVGKVIDSSKGALPGVTVTATSKDTGATREAVTDAEGSYAITNLGPGTYSVTIELAGFQTQRREVVLGVGEIEALPVELGRDARPVGMLPATVAHEPEWSGVGHPALLPASA